MKKNILTGLAITFGLVMLVSSCVQPTAPVYQGVENIRVSSLGAKESAISADLKYYNPNAIKMKLKHGEMDVYINNHFLGKTLLDTLTQVPAKDSFRIPVSMKIDMKQVYSNALDLILNNEVTIKLDGFARLGKGLLNYNVPIHYEGKQKLDIHL